jgi:hypothetical protein
MLVEESRQFPRHREPMMSEIWEYQIERRVRTNKVLEVKDFLDEVGRSGWELAAVEFDPISNYRTFFLKRRDYIPLRLDKPKFAKPEPKGGASDAPGGGGMGDMY